MRPAKKGAAGNPDILAEKEALKADLRRMRKGKSGKHSDSDDTEPGGLADTAGSNFVVTLGKSPTPCPLSSLVSHNSFSFL